MPSLFENAISSIRMGVEDFRQQDAARDISAVRNFYAGVLLLAKEAITRAAPNADPAIMIAAKIKPVPDGSGGVTITKIGHTTVDFNQISERAKDFGVSLDHKALEGLNKIRNDMEHHYTTESSAGIRAAISKGFPVVASLFRQLREDPTELLEDAWVTMLETKELYEQQLKEARATLSNVAWYSPSIGNSQLACDACQSEIVEQIDSENKKQDEIQLRCKTCGSLPDLTFLVETILEDIYEQDSYSRVKDGDDGGAIYDCPACGRAALIAHEEICANCGEQLDYESECIRCSGGISIQEYLDGLDGGLCSWCSHMSDKVMRE